MPSTTTGGRETRCQNPMIPSAQVAPHIARWARHNHLNRLDPVTARLCRSILSGDQQTVTLDRVDRLLIALDLSPALLNEILPLEAA